MGANNDVIAHAVTLYLQPTMDERNCDICVILAYIYHNFVQQIHHLILHTSIEGIILKIHVLAYSRV